MRKILCIVAPTLLFVQFSAACSAENWQAKGASSRIVAEVGEKIPVTDAGPTVADAGVQTPTQDAGCDTGKKVFWADDNKGHRQAKSLDAVSLTLKEGSAAQIDISFLVDGQAPYGRYCEAVLFFG
jgi:hypothetical protein